MQVVLLLHDCHNIIEINTCIIMLKKKLYINIARAFIFPLCYFICVIGDYLQVIIIT